MAHHLCQCVASRILFRLGAQLRAVCLGLGSGRRTGAGLWLCGVGVIAFSLVLLTQGRADELIDRPVYSPLKQPIPFYCEITQLPELGCHPIPPMDKCHKIKVNLDANELKDDIGGFTVATENYNGSYLTLLSKLCPAIQWTPIS